MHFYVALDRFKLCTQIARCCTISVHVSRTRKLHFFVLSKVFLNHICIVGTHKIHAIASTKYTIIIFLFRLLVSSVFCLYLSLGDILLDIFHTSVTLDLLKAMHQNKYMLILIPQVIPCGFHCKVVI